MYFTKGCYIISNVVDDLVELVGSVFFVLPKPLLKWLRRYIKFNILVYIESLFWTGVSEKLGFAVIVGQINEILNSIDSLFLEKGLGYENYFPKDSPQIIWNLGVIYP